MPSASGGRSSRKGGGGHPYRHDSRSGKVMAAGSRVGKGAYVIVSLIALLIYGRFRVLNPVTTTATTPTITSSSAITAGTGTTGNPPPDANPAEMAIMKSIRKAAEKQPPVVFGRPSSSLSPSPPVSKVEPPQPLPPSAAAVTTAVVQQPSSSPWDCVNLDRLHLPIDNGTTITTPTTLENLTPLPDFTHNTKAYALGAVLTRDEKLPSTDGNGNGLAVDVMFMGTKVFVGGGSWVSAWTRTGRWIEATGSSEATSREEAREKVRTMDKEVWQWENGGFYCRIYHPGYHGPPMEWADMVVVPVETTVDGNVNSIVSILRCEVPPLIRQFLHDHRTGQLEVEVVEDLNSNYEPVVNFTVPVASRTSGFIYYPTAATSVDWWRDRKDEIHMCVPMLRSPFKSPLTEMVVEWLEYHIMMGVQHFYIGVDYDWDTPNMRRFMLLLDPYISEGLVSISSMNKIPGIGIDWDPKKTYFFNQCLYHAKSMATWVGIWDLDELVVPRDPKSGNIHDLIKRYTTTTTTTTTTTPSPDICYLLMTSYSHALPPVVDRNHLWIGEKFATTREEENDDARQKSILSTANVYFTGFHLPGACSTSSRDWKSIVYFDDSYCKRVNMNDTAVYHYRNLMDPRTYDGRVKLVDSEYTLHYYEENMKRVKRRGMDRLLELLRVIL